MSAKKAIAVIVLIGVIAGGSYVGLFLYAASKLGFEITEVDIDKVNLHPTSVDLYLHFKVNVTSPTGFNVTVDGATYEVSINGTYVGPGRIDKFTATKEGSITTAYLNATGLTGDHLSLLAAYISGADLAVQITVTGVTIMGITIPLNISETVIVSS